MRQSTNPVKPSWFRWNCEEYSKATMLISLEHEGLYARINNYVLRGVTIPVDHQLAAKLLRVNLLKYRKLLPGLLEAGIVIEIDDRLTVQWAEQARDDTIASIVKARRSTDNVVHLPQRL